MLKVKYKVANILPKYITVNGRRDVVSMLAICSFGPYRIPKDAINVKEPKVKQRANFWGRIAIMGKPTLKPRRKNRADRKSNAQNIWKIKKRKTKQWARQDFTMSSAVARFTPIDWHSLTHSKALLVVHTQYFLRHGRLHRSSHAWKVHQLRRITDKREESITCSKPAVRTGASRVSSVRALLLLVPLAKSSRHDASFYVVVLLFLLILLMLLILLITIMSWLWISCNVTIEYLRGIVQNYECNEEEYFQQFVSSWFCQDIQDLLWYWKTVQPNVNETAGPSY